MSDPTPVGSSGPARSAGDVAACPIPIPDPGGTAEPTAADPWRVTLCWTPTQNHGVVSVWPSRAPLTAIAGLLRAGETDGEVAAEHGLSAVEVTVLRHLVDDLDQPRREAPLYEHTARAIEAALDAADMELALTHGGQPVRLYSLARVLDKAGLIDWTNVPDSWDDNTTAPVDIPDADELHLVRLPGRKSGMVTIGHSRLPMVTIMEFLAAGADHAAITNAYPDVTPEALRVLAQLRADVAFDHDAPCDCGCRGVNAAQEREAPEAAGTPGEPR